MTSVAKPAMYVLLIMWVAVFGAIGRTQVDAKGSLKITVDQPSSPFKLGDAITLHVRVDNVSEKVVSFPEHQNMTMLGMFRMDVAAEDGVPVTRWADERPAAEPGSDIGNRSIEILRPGEHITRTVWVTRVFHFKSPGAYTFRLTYLDANQPVTSMPVTFQVVEAAP